MPKQQSDRYIYPLFVAWVALGTIAGLASIIARPSEDFPRAFIALAWIGSSVFYWAILVKLESFAFKNRTNRKTFIEHAETVDLAASAACKGRYARDEAALVLLRRARSGEPEAIDYFIDTFPAVEQPLRNVKRRLALNGKYEIIRLGEGPNRRMIRGPRAVPSRWRSQVLFVVSLTFAGGSVAFERFIPHLPMIIGALCTVMPSLIFARLLPTVNDTRSSLDGLDPGELYAIWIDSDGGSKGRSGEAPPAPVGLDP